LFLVPVDSTNLKVHLPVNSHLDRFVVIVLLVAWIWLGGDQRTLARSRRSKLFVFAAGLFTALAVASLLLDSATIINLGDFTLAEKRLSLLLAFLVISWFTMTALRVEDLRGMSTYLVWLGAIMAVGILVERRTGYNVFYSISTLILSPIATVAPSPTDIHPALIGDYRATIVGPTQHGLAATTLLVVTMPFALVRVLDGQTRRQKLAYGLAFALMLAAAIATQRKSALLVPIAVVIYLLFYRPRQMLRLAPFAVVLFGFVHLSSPGALGSITNLTTALNSGSTAHRASGFSSITPDVLAHPVLGRGFGTIDTDKVNQFRILDDQYLDELWEVGIIGLAAYLWMIISPIVLARRMIRSGDPTLSSIALAASAGCVAYLVVNGLFDALSFVQAPYIFFIVAAMCTVASGGREPQPARVGRRLPVRHRARNRATVAA
jgi:hypothetical protein